VVDDQDAVRRTTTRLLNQLGHTTYEAGSIADALAALEGTAAACDVVLTDVALGAGENGAELGAEIARRRPELLVLYMSGYDEVLTVLPLVEGKDFIQKPFTLAQLTALLAAPRSERAQMK
jgi:DNA-binding NtrC family response regulator